MLHTSLWGPHGHPIQPNTCFLVVSTVLHPSEMAFFRFDRSFLHHNAPLSIRLPFVFLLSPCHNCHSVTTVTLKAILQNQCNFPKAIVSQQSLSNTTSITASNPNLYICPSVTRTSQDTRLVLPIKLHWCLCFKSHQACYWTIDSSPELFLQP